MTGQITCVGSDAQALQGLDRASRRQRGKPGGVVRIIYIAAFLIPAGSSLLELHSQGPATQPQIITLFNDSTCFPNDPKRALFADLDRNAQLFYSSKLSPSASNLLLGPGPTYSAFCDVAVMYLMTTEDKAIPFTTQQLMIRNAEAHCQASHGKAANISVLSLDTSHSPFLSQPEVVLDILDSMILNAAIALPRKEQQCASDSSI